MRRSECAIDLIGVSELLISCDSTRTMRCHAACSSSRSAWLKSATTRAVRPAVAIEHGAPHFVPAAASAEGPIHQAPRLAGQVLVESERGRPACRPVVGRACRHALGRLVHEQQRLCGSNANTATAISSITCVRSAVDSTALGALPLQRRAEVVTSRMTNRHRAAGTCDQTADR
jgi:hypothetical protein